MARRQIGNRLGTVVPGGHKQNGGTGAGAGYTDSDFATIDAMRARLAVLDAAKYTSARLATMTVNDMEFALKKLGG
jgi:hypothetical protein